MRLYFKNGEYKDLYNTDDEHLLQNLEEVLQEQLGDEVVEMLHSLINSVRDEVQNDLYYIQAVSYTHLDVYKRQVLTLLSVILYVQSFIYFIVSMVYTR